MALFEKRMGLEELRKRLGSFDEETAKVAAELDQHQRRVSAALARGESADKLLQVAGALRVALDSRPRAREAIEREVRRLTRASQAAAQKKMRGQVMTWAERMAGRADGVIAAINALSSAVGAWQADTPPLGAGPGGGNMPLGWAGALRLDALPSAMELLLVMGKGPGQAVATVQHAADTIRTSAAGLIDSKIAALEGDERRDPEVALEPELAAAGGR